MVRSNEFKHLRDVRLTIEQPPKFRIGSCIVLPASSGVIRGSNLYKNISSTNNQYLFLTFPPASLNIRQLNCAIIPTPYPHSTTPVFGSLYPPNNHDFNQWIIVHSFESMARQNPQRRDLLSHVLQVLRQQRGRNDGQDGWDRRHVHRYGAFCLDNP